MKYVVLCTALRFLVFDNFYGVDMVIWVNLLGIRYFSYVMKTKNHDFMKNVAVKTVISVKSNGMTVILNLWFLISVSKINLHLVLKLNFDPLK